MSTECDHALGIHIQEGSIIRASHLMPGYSLVNHLVNNFCPDCGEPLSDVRTYESTHVSVRREVRRSRQLFPGNRKMLAALMEEVGELARALIEGDRAQMRREAIQVAATAIRIADEGDADLDGRNEDMGEHLFLITIKRHIEQEHLFSFLTCNSSICLNSRILLGDDTCERLFEKHLDTINQKTAETAKGKD